MKKAEQIDQFIILRAQGKSRAALQALELIRKGMEYRSEHQLGDDFLNDFFRE